MSKGRCLCPFLGSALCLLVYITPMPHCLNHRSFTVRLEIRSRCCSNFVLFQSLCLIQVFRIHMNFTNSLSIAQDKAAPGPVWTWARGSWQLLRRVLSLLQADRGAPPAFPGRGPSALRPLPEPTCSRFLTPTRRPQAFCITHGVSWVGGIITFSTIRRVYWSRVLGRVFPKVLIFPDKFITLWTKIIRMPEG